MQIGVIYPQTEVEADPGAVRQYAQAVEAMGFSHVLAFDHVLGANTASRPGWKFRYSLQSQFHEPFVLFSFMAGATRKLGYVSGVMILTQRQAVLVAKQAACLDVLCGGRFRLGVGTGWNKLEYEALGMPFEDRGARIEEQVAVMRALWTEQAVKFKGERHTLSDCGLNPMPVQRPIPVWFGGANDRPAWNEKASMKVLRRIARIGDGWIPHWQPDERGLELRAALHEFCREYGRDPKEVGIEGRLTLTSANSSTWASQVAVWRELEVPYLCVKTMDDGLKGVEAHLKRLEEFRHAVPA